METASSASSTGRQAAKLFRQAILGERVVAEAREWIGTKFHAQASVKGVGCDCKGLVWGVARELGLPEANTFHAQVADYDLTKKDFGAPLKAGMAEVFVPVDEMIPGDVLLLTVHGKPGHLAIVTENGRAIHAQIAPNDRVKETTLRALLKMCPLDSVWRWHD